MVIITGMDIDVESDNESNKENSNININVNEDRILIYLNNQHKTQKDYEQLKTIGKKKAQKIITFRPFPNVCQVYCQQIFL